MPCVEAVLGGRRLSKSRLWEMYWEINRLKVWATYVHHSCSPTRYEQGLVAFWNRVCVDNNIPLDWNSLHQIYH